MTKHFITILCALCASATIALSAAVGEWQHYPAFGVPTGSIVTNGTTTYYVAAGNLFSYNADTDESHSYTLNGELNDSYIQAIFYNPLKHYLMVAYESGGIDIVYDDPDAAITYVADIVEADIVGSKKINDIAFASGDRVYIATDFGVVEYDDRNHVVVQAGIYNKRVTQVEVLGDYLFAYVPSSMLSIKRGERFTSLDKFNDVFGSGTLEDLFAINDSTLLLRRTDRPDYHLYIYQISADGTKMTSRHRVGTFETSSRLIHGADSNTYFASGGKLYRVDSAGEYAEVADVPEDAAAASLAVGSKGEAETWVYDYHGLSRYDLSGAQPVMTMQPYIPERITLSNAGFIRYDKKRDQIYAYNLGPSTYRMAREKANVEGIHTPQQTITISSDGSIEDISAWDYVSTTPAVRSHQKSIGVDLPVAPSSLVLDPADPSTYYLATGNDGVLKVTDGQVVAHYTSDNAPMELTWGTRAFGVALDPKGNLWTSHLVTKANRDKFMVLNVLPADKTMLATDEVTAADWVPVNIPGFSPEKDVNILIIERLGLIFAFGERLSDALAVIDTRGTWDNFDDDKYMVWTSFTDQDGKNFEPERLTSIIEDSRGRVWIGTSQGVIEITNPAHAMDPGMTINRLKVPRNDGTNSADYLLDADLIYSISEDNSGRKWVATESSGLYLVSDNGQEILQHYTPANSLLTSNTVHAVCAEPWSNTVWVGTSDGLFSFESDSSPAMSSYDDVLVYPNPVRPDYTGPVTIKGLMDGTLVKIADAAGNVVAQVRSEGGMAQWNCENANGRRLPTGVYYVMMSSGNGNDGSSKHGAVAKFMIVN